jgi:S1-C subfamily serine protease
MKLKLANHRIIETLLITSLSLLSSSHHQPYLAKQPKNLFECITYDDHPITSYNLDNNQNNSSNICNQSDTNPSPNPILNYKSHDSQYTKESLCELAKNFTVKIYSGEYWASGILIQKNTQKETTKYYVLTNDHVLKDKQQQYSIETINKNKYVATVIKKFNQNTPDNNDLDLAILEFSSPNANYRLPSVGKWQSGQKVMAVGFPVIPNLKLSQKKGEIYCTDLAEVSFNLEKPMKQGYQLGYYLAVQKGMSGGVLLNDQAELIGINGKGIPAFFRNPDIYLYRNGTRVEKPLDKLYASSWSIPMEVIVNHQQLDFLKLSPIQISNEPKLQPSQSHSSKKPAPIRQNTIKQPVINSKQTIVNPKSASQSQLYEYLEQIIVKINMPSISETNGFLGSGVIIDKKLGGLYYVITTSDILKGNNKYYEFNIADATLKSYKASVISQHPDLNLVILAFKTDKNYKLPLLNTSYDINKITQTDLMTLANWSVDKNSFNLKLTQCKLRNLASTSASNPNSIRKIYRCDNTTEPGIMFDEHRNLIGIQSQGGQIILTNELKRIVKIHQR